MTKSAVVVGSLHYDIMVDAPHRPAAGETVAGHRWYPKFGGKGGNQAVALSAAGVTTRLVSAVGTDLFADFMLSQLAEAGVDASHIARLDAPTGMSVAISDDSGEYGAVIVSGANLAIDPDTVGDKRIWSGARVLLLQNEVPDALNLAAARAAKRTGLTTCLNAAPWRDPHPDLLREIDILIVNEVEASAMTDTEVTTLAGAEAAAIAISTHVPTAIVTAGSNGVAWSAASGAGSVPALPVEVVSTHGAGDHFIGVLIARLIDGRSLPDAIEEANRSAAAFISRR